MAFIQATADEATILAVGFRDSVGSPAQPYLLFLPSFQHFGKFIHKWHTACLTN